MSSPTVLACQQCGGALRVDSNDKTTRCPWCDSSNVLRRPPREGVPPPSFVIGFSQERAEVQAAVKAWAKRVSFWAPSAFKRLELEQLHPVYAPAYLVSGVARGEWRARVGYEYTETTVGKDGVERRTSTEWHTISSPYTLRVSDLLISASERLPNAELGRIEPYDLGRLARWSDAAISGWPAEEPSRQTSELDASLAKEVRGALEPRLRALAPGDTVDDFEFTADLAETAFATTLVPVWTSLVRWSETKPRVRVLVNGQTGKVYGKPPVSWLKVTVAVSVLVALVVAAVLWLSKDGGP